MNRFRNRWMSVLTVPRLIWSASEAYSHNGGALASTESKKDFSALNTAILPREAYSSPNRFIVSASTSMAQRASKIFSAVK